jgi:hypothetical protein
MCSSWSVLDQDEFRDSKGRIAQHCFIEQHKSAEFSVNNIAKPQAKLQAQNLPMCRVLETYSHCDHDSVAWASVFSNLFSIQLPASTSFFKSFEWRLEGQKRLASSIAALRHASKLRGVIGVYILCLHKSNKRFCSRISTHKS